jgi:hypothetical protein
MSLFTAKLNKKLIAPGSSMPKLDAVRPEGEIQGRHSSLSANLLYSSESEFLMS